MQHNTREGGKKGETEKLGESVGESERRREREWDVESE
jgi:hypothetical protein